jgi:hypothetical protein
MPASTCRASSDVLRSGRVRPNTARASSATAGWSSAPSLGCTSSNDCCLSATTAAPTSTRRSSDRMLPRPLPPRQEHLIVKGALGDTRPSILIAACADGRPRASSLPLFTRLDQAAGVVSVAGSGRFARFRARSCVLRGETAVGFGVIEGHAGRAPAGDGR